MKTLQAPPQSAFILAGLLERLDASRGPVDARQYRLVAGRLSELLADAAMDWEPLIARSRAAAAIYENLRYADAGLCRSPLERAAAAEIAARAAIDQARRLPPEARGLREEAEA